MKKFIDVVFTSIKTQDMALPFMVLESAGDYRSLLVAINPYDANRLGLSTLNFLDFTPVDALSDVISSLGGELAFVTLENSGEDVVVCYLHVKTDRGVQKIEVRPGEGVYTASVSHAPVRAEECLFTLHRKKKTVSLKERIQKKNTDELLTYRLH
jgi:bifunctional DNase/RNase